MGSKFHRGKNGLEKAIVNRIVEDYTPRLLSSFALTLYSSTDMSIDDIKYTMEQCDQLWRRAQAEGWDIRQNCFDLTGIDVRRYSETGQIIYLEKYKPMTMAQKAEFKRQERLGIA